MTTASDPATVARAASVNLLGMLARSSRVLVTVFVTRVAGAGVFGLFTLALAVTDVVGRLALFGMDKSLLKFLPERKDEHGDHQHGVLAASVAIALVLGALLTAIVVVAAPWIAERWLDEPRVTLAVRIIAISILPTALTALLLTATKALKIMSYDAFVTGMFLPVSLLVLALPILWVRDDLTALAVAYAVSCLAGLLVSVWFFRRHFSLRRAVARPDGATLRRMIRFSTPLGLHDFVQFLSMKLELFILAAFVSPAAVGIYAVAAELSFVIKKFRQIFDPILIPLMSEAHDTADWRRLRAHVSRVVRWVLTLGVVYVGVLALFTTPILGIFGAEFVAGSTVLLLLCLAQLLNTGTGLLDMAMLVSGRPHINLQNVTTILVVQTVLNLLLIPRHGILGAAVAAVAAYAVVSVVRLWQSVRILDLNPFDLTHLKPLGAGVAAWLVVAAVQSGLGPDAPGWLWPALLVVFVSLYGVALRAMGFEEEDRVLLASVLERRKQNRR